MTARNRDFEDAFLSEAEVKSHCNFGWSGRVRRRLAVKDHEIGMDLFLRLPLQRFIGEIRDEGEDIGGWPALFLEAAIASGEYTDEEIATGRELLLDLAQLGPIVDELARQAAIHFRLDPER